MLLLPRSFQWHLLLHSLLPRLYPFPTQNLWPEDKSPPRRFLILNISYSYPLLPVYFLQYFLTLYYILDAFCFLLAGCGGMGGMGDGFDFLLDCCDVMFCSDCVYV